MYAVDTTRSELHLAANEHLENQRFNALAKRTRSQAEHYEAVTGSNPLDVPRQASPVIESLPELQVFAPNNEARSCPISGIRTDALDQCNSFQTELNRRLGFAGDELGQQMGPLTDLASMISRYSGRSFAGSSLANPNPLIDEKFCLDCYERDYKIFSGKQDTQDFQKKLEGFEKLYKDHLISKEIYDSFAALHNYNQGLHRFYGFHAKSFQKTPHELTCNNPAAITKMLIGDNKRPSCRSLEAELEAESEGKKKKSELHVTLKNRMKIWFGGIGSQGMKNLEGSIGDDLTYYLGNFGTNLTEKEQGGLTCSTMGKHGRHLAGSFYTEQHNLKHATYGLLDKVVDNIRGNAKAKYSIKRFCASKTVPQDSPVSKMFVGNFDSLDLGALLQNSNARDPLLKQMVEFNKNVRPDNDKDWRALANDILMSAQNFEPNLFVLLNNKQVFCKHLVEPALTKSDSSAKDLVFDFIRQKPDKIQEVMAKTQAHCDVFYENLADSLCLTRENVTDNATKDNLETAYQEAYVYLEADLKLRDEQGLSGDQSILNATQCKRTAFSDFDDGLPRDLIENNANLRMSLPFTADYKGEVTFENSKGEAETKPRSEAIQEVIKDVEEGRRSGFDVNEFDLYNMGQIKKEGSKFSCNPVNIERQLTTMYKYVMGVKSTQAMRLAYFKGYKNSLLPPPGETEYVSTLISSDDAVGLGFIIDTVNKQPSLSNTALVSKTTFNTISSSPLTKSRPSSSLESIIKEGWDPNPSYSSKLDNLSGQDLLAEVSGTERNMSSSIPSTESETASQVYEANSGEMMSREIASDELTYYEENIAQPITQFQPQRPLSQTDVADIVQSQPEVAETFEEVTQKIAKVQNTTPQQAAQTTVQALTEPAGTGVEKDLADQNAELARQIAALRQEVESSRTQKQAKEVKEGSKEYIKYLEERVAKLESNSTDPEVRKNATGSVNTKRDPANLAGAKVDSTTTGLRSLGGTTGGQPNLLMDGQALRQALAANSLARSRAIETILNDPQRFVKDNDFNLKYNERDQKLYLRVDKQDVNAAIDLADIVVNQDGQVEQIVFESNEVVKITDLNEESRTAINHFVSENIEEIEKGRKVRLAELKEQIQKVQKISEHAEAIEREPSSASSRYKDLVCSFDPDGKQCQELTAAYEATLDD